MRRSFATLALLLSLSFAASGCYTLEHRVGDGAQGGSESQERQWYVLWGLVPLNHVNSQQMAGDASNYTVTSEITVIDFLFNLVTAWVTIYSQTVTVER